MAFRALVFSAIARRITRAIKTSKTTELRTGDVMDAIAAISSFPGGKRDQGGGAKHEGEEGEASHKKTNI
jgi:hypothetical protein